MRAFLVVVVFSAAVSCTKPNPDACCTTEAQCTSFGVTGGVRPCDAARVCTADGACVAPQCMVDMDCRDPSTPVCVASLCVAKCGVDADCTDPAAPKCDSAGACVACIDAGQCTSAEAPVCDGSAHTCRACSADADCESGVCLEHNGECAGSGEILYVSASGSDNAACSEGSPCLTIAAAIAIATPQHDVIRLSGATVSTGSATIYVISDDVTIDGSGTSLISTGSANTALFDINGAGGVLLEGVSVRKTSNGDPLVHVGGGHFSTYASSIAKVDFAIDGGRLDVAACQLDGVGFDGSGGTVVVTQSALNSATFFNGPSLQIERNVFTGNGGAISSGALVHIENNVFTSPDPLADEVSLQGVQSSSTFRFNTFVNLSGTINDGVPVHCSPSLGANSNIIAWNTRAPYDCQTTYTLYDSESPFMGSGNLSADVSTFFVDLAAGDYHLAAGSPAIGHADPTNTVGSDFDGNPRPNPAGTVPDIGAFEAP